MMYCVSILTLILHNELILLWEHHIYREQEISILQVSSTDPEE